MGYFHVIRFAREIVTHPEEFIRLTAEQKGEQVKLLGYIPKPPWEDSSLSGKRMILRCERPLGSFYTGDDLRRFGYALEKIYTGFTLKDIGYTINGIRVD